METISNNELNNKILDLGKKICEVKGFNIENYSISNMAEKIYYYSIWFNDYYEITKLDYDDKKIILEVSDQNTSALNLYKKYNFIEINRRKGYYNGIDAIIMEKK